MPSLHSRRNSTRQDKNECVNRTFVLSVTFSTCSCLSQSSWKHVGKSVPSQRKRECLKCLASLSKVLWLHSHSVLEPFTDYLLCWEFFFSSPLSHDFQEFHLSHSSCTRVWMSTFVRTLSHSQFLESLDECPRWEYKPGINTVEYVSKVRNSRYDVWACSRISRSQAIFLHTYIACNRQPVYRKY